MEQRENIRGWIKDILIAVVIALIVTTFIKPTIVKGPSMENTLKENDYLILNKWSYWKAPPKAGDIIVFHSVLKDEHGDDKKLIKRVIATPGETVLIQNGEVKVNGKIIAENYISGQSTEGYVDLVVPKGKVFCLGDNRGNSTDSRNPNIGCISVKEIKGKIICRLFPFNKIGLVK